MSSATKLTYEDYLAIPDDGRRHELIDGEHYVVPAPNPLHQIVSGNIYDILSPYVKRTGIGRILYAPLDVILTSDHVVQPDLLFVAREHASRIDSRGVVGAPDLIIEILSGNRRYDEHVKRRLYESCGVREYWIVDPEARSILALRLSGGRYVEQTITRTLTSPLFPSLEINLTDVFA